MNHSEPVEVEPGIIRLTLPLPFQLKEIHVYLLLGGDGPALIDTGMNTEEGLEALEAGLALAGIPVASIKKVVLTHFHRDHSGCAAFISRNGGAEVYMHDADFRFMREIFKEPHSMMEMLSPLKAYGVEEGRLEALNSAFVALARFVPEFPETTALHDGAYIQMGGRKLKAIWTPGHTPGHLSLYDEGDEVLLCGDCLLSDITPNIHHTPLFPEQRPLGQYLNTLKRLAGLGARLALTAHGEMIEDVAGRAKEIRAHHRERANRVMEIIGTAQVAVPEICKALYGRLEIFDWWLGMGETMAHLVELVDEGRLRTIEEKGVVLFSRNATTVAEPG